MSVTINGTNGLVFADSSTQNTAATGFGFKNRIINGAMMIDQRNAGASVSISSANGGQYEIDRYIAGNTTAGTYTVQQSSTVPSGFNKSYAVTVSVADTSIAATDIAWIETRIEGFNCSDLGFGAAGASTVTLSFYVYSNLTGTFTGAILNGSANRSYSFEYTISAANTWERKTITIAGDTAGTWAKDNGLGIAVRLALACGSNYQQAAGSWGTGNAVGTSNQVNLMATVSNVFQFTGLQLEKGSTATSFDYRPYGTELALCQRYLPCFTGNNNCFGFGIAVNTSDARCTVQFPVQTRVAPSGLYIASPYFFDVSDFYTVSNGASAISINVAGVDSAVLNITSSVANLTPTRPTTLYATNSAANLYFTGCEL